MKTAKGVLTELGNSAIHPILKLVDVVVYAIGLFISFGRFCQKEIHFHLLL
jgi:hypothetical protein